LPLVPRTKIVSGIATTFIAIAQTVESAIPGPTVSTVRLPLESIVAQRIVPSVGAERSTQGVATIRAVKAFIAENILAKQALTTVVRMSCRCEGEYAQD
jgi:hypothetical protein